MFLGSSRYESIQKTFFRLISRDFHVNRFTKLHKTTLRLILLSGEPHTTRRFALGQFAIKELIFVFLLKNPIKLDNFRRGFIAQTLIGFL